MMAREGRSRTSRLVTSVAVTALALVGMVGTAAADPRTVHSSAPQLERSRSRPGGGGDRPRACSSAGGCSARRSTGRSERALRGPAFRVYRDRPADRHRHRQHQLPRPGRRPTRPAIGWPPVVRGREQRESAATVRPWSQAYVDLPLQKPADGVTPAGEAYTYSANDMSVGDVDGDGIV